MLVALLKDVFLSSGILSCDTNLLGRVSALSPPFGAAGQRSRVANLDVKGMPSSVVGVQSFVSDLGYVDGGRLLANFQESVKSRLSVTGFLRF